MLLPVEPLLAMALDKLQSRRGLCIEDFVAQYPEFSPELLELLPNLILMTPERRNRALGDGCLQVACELQMIDGR